MGPPAEADSTIAKIRSEAMGYLSVTPVLE
jgi:hypothetical protein